MLRWAVGKGGLSRLSRTPTVVSREAQESRISRLPDATASDEEGHGPTSRHPQVEGRSYSSMNSSSVQTSARRSVIEPSSITNWKS